MVGAEPLSGAPLVAAIGAAAAAAPAASKAQWHRHPLAGGGAAERGVESFNGKLRDECVNREWFPDLREARLLVEQWRQSYNAERLHSALGYQTPAHARAEWHRMEQRLTA